MHNLKTRMKELAAQPGCRAAKYAVLLLSFAMLSATQAMEKKKGMNDDIASILELKANDEYVKPPLPDDYKERYERFTKRDQGEQLGKLAKDFFSLVDYKDVDESIGEDLANGRHLRALETYRDFFVKRMKDPQNGWDAKHPDERVFLVFFNLPDLLVQNKLHLIATEHRKYWNQAPVSEGGNFFEYPWESHKGKFDYKIEAEPGKFKWSWAPEGFKRVSLHFAHAPDSGSNTALSYYNLPHFFNALLVGYYLTQDAKYLQKWSEYVDFRDMYFLKDASEAGYAPRNLTGSNEIEYYQKSVLPALTFLARETSDFENVLSAPTLARMLIRMWTQFVGATCYKHRYVLQNRKTHFSPIKNAQLGLLMPEFLPAQYMIREYARILEMYPHIDMRPDGSDLEYHLNYNSNYLRGMEEFRKASKDLTAIPPQCLGNTPLTILLRELDDNKTRREDYLQFTKFHGGGLGIMISKWPRFKDDRGPLYKRGMAGKLDFRSNAFPYHGTYIIRSGWDPASTQAINMDSVSPSTTATWANQNNINFFAYGDFLMMNYKHFWFRNYTQRPEEDADFDQKTISHEFLKAKRASFIGQMTPILVDDGGQIDHSTRDRYPEELRSQEFLPKEERYALAHTCMANREVRKRRWHESDHFNFCEGTYSGAYTPGSQGWLDVMIQNLYAPVDMMPEVAEPFVDDTTHHREIYFVRDANLWLITDRMKSEKPRKYNLEWPWLIKPEYRQVTANSIVTSRPEYPNVSVHSYASAPTGKAYGEFQGKDELIVSALYARRDADDNLQSVKPVNGENLYGVQVKTKDGRQVTYVTSKSKGEISIGDFHGNCAALLLLENPDGSAKGMMFDGDTLRFKGEHVDLPSANVEFRLDKNGALVIDSEIRVPMNMARITPARNVFTDKISVTLSHEDSANVNLHYTLDGSDPDLDSPVYAGPLTLAETTHLKVMAFRKGIEKMPMAPQTSMDMSVVNSAVFVKEPFWKPTAEVDAEKLLNGTRLTYRREGLAPLDATNMMSYDATKEVTQTDLMDVSVHGDEKIPYVAEYNGYFQAEKDGVYAFHAPAEFLMANYDPGYDLRLFLDGKEWHPTRRTHGFGTWYVPLKKGYYPFQCVFLNYNGSLYFKRDVVNIPQLRYSEPERDERLPLKASLFTEEGI